MITQDQLKDVLERADALYRKIEHPIMGQTDLTGLRIAAATRKSHIGDGMMRMSERTFAYKRSPMTGKTCYGMYLSSFNTLLFCKRRQN